MPTTDLIAIISALLSLGAAYGALRSRLSAVESSIKDLTTKLEDTNGLLLRTARDSLQLRRLRGALPVLRHGFLRP